ncbi:DUF3499 family protein, partial [Modestobacter roseus]|uniref:DUF3499 family protein n=1 Tax=Modestobacter roseus TaxID=1181884 RepID=UPI002B2160E9
MPASSEHHRAGPRADQPLGDLQPDLAAPAEEQHSAARGHPFLLSGLRWRVGSAVRCPVCLLPKSWIRDYCAGREEPVVRQSRRCSRSGCAQPAAATLTYVYAESTAVVGPLATYSEP